MHELLYQSINRLVPLTEAEFAPIAAALTSRSLAKKEVLLRAGEVCHSLSFVQQGLVRVFATDAKGMEFIDQFAFEGWWGSDLYSFLTREPGLYTIDALEPTQVLQLSYEAVQHLLDTRWQLLRSSQVALGQSSESGQCVMVGLGQVSGLFTSSYQEAH